MSLFDELFNGGRRNDEDFSKFLNEMMRRYEGMINNSMRRNDFPFDIKEERGDNWLKQSAESEDGSMKWSSFTRTNDGERLNESELNEMLSGLFSANGRTYNSNHYRPISKTQKLLMLEEDLQDAIEEEEFEKAAKLRDLISELKLDK